MSLLRIYIRKILAENSLLGEPDFIEDPESVDDEKQEQDSVAGVITPLGTGPNWPNRRTGQYRSPAAAAGSAFGGAKPYKKSRKN
jgi:hypothetical protein